jgi:hypothetical protein
VAETMNRGKVQRAAQHPGLHPTAAGKLTGPPDAAAESNAVRGGALSSFDEGGFLSRFRSASRITGRSSSSERQQQRRGRW